MNKKYVPDTLSKEDKKKQVQSIVNKTVRPNLESFISKPSPFVESFKKKYKTNISDYNYIDKEIIRKAGIDQILDKGRGAYYNSGSRPNQTAESWARARLASVIMGGKAREVDRDIWQRYKR